MSKKEKEKKMDKSLVKTTKGLNVSIWALVIISFLVISAILIWQLFYDNGMIPSNRFYENTQINGINVAGMDKGEAANLIASRLSQDKNQITIKLTYKEKEWEFTGADFEENSNVFPIIEQAFEKGRSGSIAEKMNAVRRIKTDGFNTQISYRNILGGFDEKVDQILAEINSEPVEPSINFYPDASENEIFELKEGVNGVEAKKETLYAAIDEAFSLSKNIVVEIPIKEIAFEKDGEELLANAKIRSSFYTSYISSQSGRKNNVKLALSQFNGMVIQSEEEVSFNEKIGETTPEKGYQKAKVILNGSYVDDYGGGVCQASTTLYNALILADIEIKEVNPHSLPVSYVPLAFDAMVSDGYSDLKFKNNLEYPIYIKAWGDEEKVYVNIYGKPLAEGEEIRRKTEFIEFIPHQGDMIVKDVKGEYANKITYAGEYLRIKHPQEGYHSKGYICYYKDDKLIDEKLIRDEIYKPQKGIVMEGTETLGEGMIIPENGVKIIPPQISVSITEAVINQKISEHNPSEFNP